MKKMITMALVSMMALSLAACGGGAAGGSTPSSPSGTPEAGTIDSDSPSPQTISVTSLDASRQKITLDVPYNPKRIAVLDMAVLDMLDNWGLGDRVVGMPKSSFVDYLSSYNDNPGIANLGTLKEVDLEALMSCEPDLIFIGGLGFGIVCSAMTTVIAEAFSAVLAGWWLWTKTPELCPRRGQWRVDRSLLGRTLQYGGVSALQQAVQPIGKVLIQGQVNALGVEVIAAFNAVTRIDDFACIPEQSIAQGITTYIAQNRGAGRQDRIRRGFAVGLGMEAAYWMLIGGVVTLFKTPLAAMFVTGEGADRVIALAVQYLGTMALFYLLPAMTNGFQGYYRGIGNMPMTLLGTLIQTSLRVVTTCILAPRMGMYGIAFACATGWCVMLMVEVPFYFWQKARNE